MKAKEAAMPVASDTNTTGSNSNSDMTSPTTEDGFLSSTSSGSSAHMRQGSKMRRPFGGGRISNKNSNNHSNKNSSSNNHNSGFQEQANGMMHREDSTSSSQNGVASNLADDFHDDDATSDGDHDTHEHSGSSHAFAPSGHSISSHIDDQISVGGWGKRNTKKTSSKGRGASSSRTGTSKLVASETRWILCSKALFFLVLMVAAGLSAFFVWQDTANKEQHAYERALTDVANAAIAASKQHADFVTKTYDTISLQITAQQEAAQELDHTSPYPRRWPFVYLHGFEARTIQLIDYTETKNIAFSPLVHVDDEAQYEAFVLGLLDEAIKENLEFTGHPDANLDIIPYIHDLSSTGVVDAVPTKDGLFSPILNVGDTWFNGNITNFNMFNEPLANMTVHRVMQTRKTVVSPIQGIANEMFDDPAALSLVGAPIFRSLDLDDKTVVGTLSGQIEWIGYLRGILPEGTDPVYIVLECTCTKSYTYLVEGPEVTYIGEGLQIDEVEGRGASDGNIRISGEYDTYVTFQGCGFFVHVHPTQDFYDAIVTTQPTINAITIVATFLLTAIIFVLYDILVERRQKEIIKSADQSNAIVTSLFPANVRDRLMNDAAARRPPNSSKQGDSPTSRNTQKTAQKINSSSGNLITNVFQDKGMSSIIASAPLQNPLASATASMSKSSGKYGSGKPIADLFPFATVLFADIVGFTAWSSMREPTQVFELLETLYNTFDRVARRLGVFKVETIGDCYVAATGLPEPNPDHAIVMARFSKHCMSKMRHVVNKLAVTLGPDTGILSMRCGLHSGPVTGGVLRGDKSRFQLFGDTVNTAARLEQTSIPNKIQLSQATADELTAANRSSWIVARDDKIVAKGKGEMQTYWLLFEGLSSSDGSVISKEISLSIDGGETATLNASNETDKNLLGESPGADDPNEKRTSYRRFKSINSNDGTAETTQNPIELEEQRKAEIAQMNFGELNLDDMEENTANLQDPSRMHQIYEKKNITQLEVQWNVDVLKNMLQKILAMRESGADPLMAKARVAALSINRRPGEIVLDEVQEVIALPQAAAQYKQDPATIEVDPKVIAQLRDFVKNIASMYRDNPFHNFSHASHVVQSTTKLMSRIVTATHVDNTGMSYKDEQPNTLAMHRFTYGITSDPVTQFACILAALIHDVDHSGVPNVQLGKEQSRLAKKYRGKSVAEQHSLDLAWNLLMERRYADFRACIYSNQEELDRFRQLLVNSVMATDIIDKELNNLRKARWEKAFSGKNNEGRRRSEAQGSIAANSNDGNEDDEEEEEGDVESVNRMATIVIEHLIQASDVSHTMQHWHVYVKWNEKLFDEIYEAFKEGRAKTDPSRAWYQGELWFFDNYIIPLAKKLEDCGVFGVSSDEYLNYAKANRLEWENRGEEVVKGYMAKHRET